MRVRTGTSLSRGSNLCVGLAAEMSTECWGEGKKAGVAGA